MVGARALASALGQGRRAVPQAGGLRRAVCWHMMAACHGRVCVGRGWRVCASFVCRGGRCVAGVCVWSSGLCLCVSVRWLERATHGWRCAPATAELRTEIASVHAS